MSKAFNLAKALVLPDGVWGYFEWFTGTIRLNVDAETFDKGLLSGVQQQELDETYYHEFFHCCQICTTGFLYYYTAHFLKGIAPVWRRLTEEGVLAQRTMPQILSAVFEDTPAISESMNQLFSNMDKPDEPSSLSARMIIESQAFFVQKCLTEPSLRHEGYLKIAEKVPLPEYTKAYLLASGYLGERTFALFNAIAYTSLLFFEPQRVFERLCVEVSRSQGGPESLKNIAQSLSGEFLYLGDSGDVTEKYILNQEINPFYKPNILLLRSIAQTQGGDFFALMSDPAAWYKNTIKRLDVPMIFNHGEVYEHAYDKEWQVFDRSFDKKLHLILGTICLIIDRQNQQAAPHYLHLKTLPASD